MRDRRNTGSLLPTLSSPSLLPVLMVDEKAAFLLPTQTHLTDDDSVLENYGWRKQVQHSIMLKILLTSCAALLIWHSFFSSFYTSPVPASTLGEHTTVRYVHDQSGRLRWTTDIPHTASFPLQPSQYKAMCTQGDDLRKTILEGSRVQRISHYTSKHRDKTFLDIVDAEAAGVVPAFIDPLAANVCKTSLTFVLEAGDHSLGKTLLLLWLSYGLARKEGRPFFIDDSRWAYGKYTTYFKPVPSNDCMLPPVHHILPCPREARHLLVSTSTASCVFNDAFFAKLAGFRARGISRQHAIFQLLRKGYKDLFSLAAEDDLAAVERVEQLRNEAQKAGNAIVGMHVRHGNLHPFEQQFQDDYLPIDRYTGAAHDLISALGGDINKDDTIIVSSDDPALIDSPDLHQNVEPYHVQSAQTRIQLATKSALDRASPRQPIRRSNSAYTKHVDENSGWDGGFYPALFYAIGRRPGTIANHDAPPHAGNIHVREMIGRAYLLDLQVMGAASDGVVCAVSSATCRVLGVMMGWEKVSDGRWSNVDDNRAWSLNGRRTS